MKPDSIIPPTSLAHLGCREDHATFVAVTRWAEERDARCRVSSRRRRSIAAFAALSSLAFAACVVPFERLATAIPGWHLISTAFFQRRFAPTLSDPDRERLVRAAIDSGIPKSGVAMTTHGPDGSTRLIGTPATGLAAVDIDAESARNVTLLIVVKRQSRPDSVWIELGASELLGASPTRRAALVEVALRRRGISDVRVSALGAGLRVEWTGRASR